MKKLTLILVLIACGAAGCKVMRATGSANSPGDARIDPKADVIAASKKLIALKALSAKVEGAGKAALTKKVEYVAPDRYHISFVDETGATVEMIMNETVAYIRSGDAWNKLPGEISPTPTFRNSFTDEVLQSLSDARFEGEDTVDGKPALVYTYKLMTLVGNFPVVSKMWVSKNNGLPIKTFVEYKDSQVDSLTTHFDTESPVSVELPTG